MSNITRIIAALVFATNVWAQMPHEVLVLVNKQSQASLQVANAFVALRGVPGQNVVYLDVPESAYGGNATITPEQFEELIWEPANQVVKERGLEQQVLAWIYSVDFPIRVKTDSFDRKQMSVGGLTFMRNKMPSLDMVEDGKFLSKLFSGPNERFKTQLNSISFGAVKEGIGGEAEVPAEASYLKDGLGDRMPLPNMMLGYVGEKGNDVKTVLECLVRGVRSDYRGIRGGIYFVMSDDVRSKCREWQFYPAVNELKKLQVSANVTTNLPIGEKNVMGIMMGAEKVDASSISFAPGAMAEHLTSWSAEFQRPQTKMTEWIKAGATGSAGAVVEPYSNPNKFPSARFFVHYSTGCTMMESFYQSIACPLQTLLLGDPLAKPYSLPVSVSVVGADTLKRDFTYIAKGECPVKGAQFLYAFLLDGKLVREFSDDPTIYLRMKRLSDGYHELRSVVLVKSHVRFNASSTKGIMVDRLGRSVTVRPDIKKIGTHRHGIKVDIGGADKPERVQLVSGEIVLDEKEYDPEAILMLDELVLGEGPNRVRAVAVYKDGMEVSSVPLGVNVEFKTDS